ncbi:MAG: hypothetical protein PV340_03635 [Wolbachia sp.]|nr:hypothetical protein [Wolbachia sp.]
MYPVTKADNCLSITSILGENLACKDILLDLSKNIEGKIPIDKADQYELFLCKSCFKEYKEDKINLYLLALALLLQ